MKSSNNSGVVGTFEVPEVARSEIKGAKKELSHFSNRVGRPSSLTQEKHVELLKVYYSRPYSLRQLADMFGVSRMTVWRAVQTEPGMFL